jgi:hypothetical protein
LLAEYFKEEIKAFNVICFASNWQGIMYCVDKNNKTITYFDPATCEYFSADASLEQFFGEILVDGEYDILFEGYFNEARDFMKLETFDYECSIGHKKYLHLGGNDNVDNLEIVNTDVLWNLQIQTAESLNEIDNK